MSCCRAFNNYASLIINLAAIWSANHLCSCIYIGVIWWCIGEAIIIWLECSADQLLVQPDHGRPLQDTEVRYQGRIVQAITLPMLLGCMLMEPWLWCLCGVWTMYLFKSSSRLDSFIEKKTFSTLVVPWLYWMHCNFNWFKFCCFHKLATIECIQTVQCIIMASKCQFRKVKTVKRNLINVNRAEIKSMWYNEVQIVSVCILMVPWWNY